MFVDGDPPAVLLELEDDRLAPQSTSHSSTPLSFAQVCGSLPGKVKASPVVRETDSPDRVTTSPPRTTYTNSISQSSVPAP